MPRLPTNFLCAQNAIYRVSPENSPTTLPVSRAVLARTGPDSMSFVPMLDEYLLPRLIPYFSS